MHLTYRLASPEDLSACDRMPLDGFEAAPGLRAFVASVWEKLLRDGSLVMMVVEDQDRPAHQRIVWHGGSLFVTPEFLCQARDADRPGIAGDVVRRARDGTLPALDPRAQRTANSYGGLHLLGLHYALDKTLPARDAWLVRAKAIDAYHASLEGYLIQEILIEAYGDERRRVMEVGGFRLRRHFPATAPSKRSSCLMGITREEAMADEGSVIAALFVHSSPCFYFKSGEQEMLRRALAGETDEELAQSLCLSPSTIKTRWRMIYERVQEVSPAILPANMLHKGQRRGLEKRRHLLSYLRHHPEEMRPALPLSPALLREMLSQD